MFHCAEPLTQEAFEPFGEVIEHRGNERRHRFELNVSDATTDMRHAIWVSKFSSQTEFPAKITTLERHPFSDQAFIPLNGQPFLIVACPSRGDGSPNLEHCRAFVGKPTQGLMYRRNVWHAGFEVLSLPAEFVVVMALSEEEPNDVFLQLPTPLHIQSLQADREGQA